MPRSLMRPVRHALALLALMAGAAHADIAVVDIDRNGGGGTTDGPDLIADNLGPARITVAYGEDIPFDLRVRNIGNEAADESCLTVLDGDGERDVIYTPPLDPGESDRRTWNSWNTYDPGTYTLRVCADGTQAVVEGGRFGERNNCVAFTLEVTPPPLLVEWLDLQVDPDPAVEGQRFTVTARTRNIGSAARSYPVRFELWGEPLAERFCPALLGDAPCEMSFTFDAPAEGQHTLAGFADTSSQVALFHVIGPRPNLMLTPEDVQRSVAVPRAGEPFRVDYAVLNAGQAVVDRSFRVHVYLGAERVHSTTCAAWLPVGARCRGEVTLALPAGDYSLRVVTDVYDTIDETHEADNTRFMAFAVDPGGVSCVGQWTLTGADGWQVTNHGFVQNGCDVYWSANSPFPGQCMRTVGDGGMMATWHPHPVTGCPYAVDVTGLDADGQPVNHHFTVRVR